MNANAVSQLNNELAELRKFVVLLSSEQQFLLDNDTDSLLTLSEAKTLAASQLMEIGNARRKALLTGSTDNMESWLSKHAPAQQALWAEIRKLAEQAQNLNTTNGELIQSSMRHNQQALGVLYNSSKNAAGLYGPDGQANLNNSGRHLGSG
ncbi:MAG: flagella synthesis protein FlgN [Gallionellaceae bacterium]|jgi:flagellar biosynthesis/type III secretory pathway chaperone